MAKRPHDIDPVAFLKHYTTSKGKDAMIITLKNVRLAFPDIWTPVAFEGEGEKKYGATGLIMPGSENDKLVKSTIKLVATEKWKDKAPAILKSIEGNANKYCYVDGNTKTYDGFADMMALSAKNKKRPTIKDRDASPLTETDEKPYGGCYVNMSVEIWPQDNKWGKGIRASLRGLQFVKDGDAFTAGSVAGDDEFEDLGQGADAGEDETDLA